MDKADACRGRHGFRAGALLVALAACGVMPVHAQVFTFDQKKYQTTPGATVELKIHVSQSPVSITGANFALRISSTDGREVRLADATSIPNAQLTALGFQYADNFLRRTGVTTGVITGAVDEFRGALFSTRTPPFAVPANSPPRLIATVLVPIDINAQGRVLVELVSAVDNGVALLGVANAQGNPVVPTGREVPEGDVATIVIEPGFGPIVTDLREPRNQAGWVYSSPLPGQGRPGGQGEGLPGVGLSTRAVLDGTYTVWNWNAVERGAWRTPRAQRLHVIDWRVRADVGGVETPPFRLRTMTANHLLSAENLYQDLWWNRDTVSLVPMPQGRTYRTIMEVPTFAADGRGADGVVPYFDMIQFDEIGKPGATLTLEGLEERFVDPATLAGKRLEYFQTFDSRNDGGWKFTPGDFGGHEVSFSRSRYGLGITSGGPLEVDEQGNQRYSYGFWYAEPAMTRLKANSTRWYQVEAHLFGTADNPVWNATARLRLHPANHEFYTMLLMASQLDRDDYHVPRPDLNGMTLTAWFVPPPDIEGMDLGMAFDLIHLDAPPDGTDRTPALFLKWVRVSSYEAPVLP
jgi:hypothetical protein